MSSQQIQYGGRPPYWKSSFGYISTSDYPINAKFCSIKQKHVLTQVTWPKYLISKTRWRTAAILKMVLSLYLSRKSSDFDEICRAAANYASKDGHMTEYHNFANSNWRTAATMKIVFFGYNSTIYCLINAKFRTTEQNYTETQVTWPKYSGGRHLNRGNKTANINVKKCSLSTTYNSEMTHRKQQK